ncbi:hypothetical protein LSUE1_G008634 [Lachnellula suecica]|uniref:Uncharacterized protein n=1 Tax=Lachnellula suecica TaxID=602035 RepID=A0A8T9BZS2_9HELO|nr:hypothetical protein LSUE1_G008634 [Lachnellula suecica]
MSDGRLLECGIRDLLDDVRWEIHFDFSSTVFRMAMKAHRLRRDTTTLLTLLSSQTNDAREGYVEQRSIKVRIQNDSLLMRDQRVFMIPRSQQFPLPWDARFDICAHYNLETVQSLYEHGVHIPHADEVEGYENSEGILYCVFCHTEFRVDFKSYGAAGNALFVTRWMDLGDGRHPKDPKYASRLKSRSYTPGSIVNYRRGSICATFEQIRDSSEFKIDSLLTQQNEKDLCTQSPSAWPKDIDLSRSTVNRRFKVEDGRFVLMS